MTQRTKSLKSSYRILLLLDWILTLVPLIIFGIFGFLQGQPKEKFALGALFIVALIFTIINVIGKLNYRFFVWLLLLGIYLCIDNVLPVLITTAACTFLDEIVIIPLKQSYKTRLITSKELDYRG